MKKFIVAATLLVSTAVFSQRIQEGGSQINGGFGFSSGWGIPVYLGYDYALTNDITVGGQATFVTEDNDSWFGLGAKGDYHFNRIMGIPNNFDLYAGLTLAYNQFSYDDDTIKHDNDSELGFAGQLGGRYFFNDKFGVNLEFRGGNVASGGKIGITYILK